MYASDHEPHDPALAGGGLPRSGSADDRHADFLADADVVIHDTQYDAAGYPAKVGWGHSTMEYAVALAGAVGVGRLVLYHHDPQRDDDGVDDLLRPSSGVGGLGRRVGPSRSMRPQKDPCSRFGTADRPRWRTTGDGHRRARSGDLAVGVAIAHPSDSQLEAAVEAAATAEGLTVRMLAADLSDAVVVVDADDGDRCNTRSVDRSGGMLGVTRHAIPSVPIAGIIDWIVLPASIAHIRTKLRAAVLRRRAGGSRHPSRPTKRVASRPCTAWACSTRRVRRASIVLVEQAREIAATPIALVSLVDSQRQWFKATAGFDVTESHRDQSICAHAILGPDVFQVPDAFEDSRFADNPAVAGAIRVRFYAGVPLALADGSRVGTLCVADRRPRLLDDRQLEALCDLAALVVAELQAIE